MGALFQVCLEKCRGCRAHEPPEYWRRTGFVHVNVVSHPEKLDVWAQGPGLRHHFERGVRRVKCGDLPGPCQYGDAIPCFLVDRVQIVLQRRLDATCAGQTRKQRARNTFWRSCDRLRAECNYRWWRQPGYYAFLRSGSLFMISKKSFLYQNT